MNILKKHKLTLKGSGGGGGGNSFSGFTATQPQGIDAVITNITKPLTFADFSFLKVKNAIMLLIGINYAYINNKPEWWENGRLTLDAVEFLIKNFLIKTDYTANFNFYYDSNIYSDRSSTSSLENAILKFNNGSLLNGYSIYSLQKRDLIDLPFVPNSDITKNNFPTFTTIERTNYNTNFIYLYDSTLDVVNSANEYVIEYNIFDNRVLSNNASTSTSTYWIGGGNNTVRAYDFSKSTQQITAGTRLPTVVTIKVETGYECESNCCFTSDGDYYCYKYDIFGVANSTAMIDLGRKSYDFVHAQMSCNILQTTANLTPRYYTDTFNSDFYLIRSSYISGSPKSVKYYLKSNKDFIFGSGCYCLNTYCAGYVYSDTGTNLGANILSSFNNLDSNLKQFCIDANYVTGVNRFFKTGLGNKGEMVVCSLDIQNLNLSNRATTGTGFYQTSPIDKLFPSGICIFNTYIDSSPDWDWAASKYDNYTLAYSGQTDFSKLYHCLDIFKFNYCSSQQVAINNYQSRDYTDNCFYVFAYYDFNKPNLKNYLSANNTGDIFYYLNINGKICDTAKFLIKGDTANINADNLSPLGLRTSAELHLTSNNLNLYKSQYYLPFSTNANCCVALPYLIQEENCRFYLKSDCNTSVKKLTYATYFTNNGGNYLSGSCDFTIEFWVKPKKLSTDSIWFSTDTIGTGYCNQIMIGATANSDCYFLRTSTVNGSWNNISCADVSTSIGIPTIASSSSVSCTVDWNMWQHLSLVRYSGVDQKYCYFFFKNGEILGTFMPTTNNKFNAFDTISIGGTKCSTTAIIGSCACFASIRILCGCALHTGSFSICETSPSAINCTTFLANFGSTKNPNLDSPYTDVLLRFSNCSTISPNRYKTAYPKKTIFKTQLKLCAINEWHNIDCEFYKYNYINNNTAIDINSIFGNCNYIDKTTVGLGFDFLDSTDASICSLGLVSSSLNSCLSYNTQLSIFNGSLSTTSLSDKNKICTINKGEYYSSNASNSSTLFDRTVRFYYINDKCIVLKTPTSLNNYAELDDQNLRSYPYLFNYFANLATPNGYTCICATCVNQVPFLCTVQSVLNKNNLIPLRGNFLNFNTTPLAKGTCAVDCSYDDPDHVYDSGYDDYGCYYYCTCTYHYTDIRYINYCYYEAEMTNNVSYYQLYSSVNNDSIKLPAPKYDTQGKPLRRYVKVTKMSHETLSSLISKVVGVQKFTEIIPQRFSYPFSAIVGTKIDSRAFSQVPNRTFDCKLKKVLVPSNYFPVDRSGKDVRYLNPLADSIDLPNSLKNSDGKYKIYLGDWDGSFKMAWTNNPAWILMDMLINKRYGLGNYIESNQIDIWELYKIARWCDCVDDNGYYYGVPDTYGGIEPRQTFNGLIQDKFNIFDMINQIASTFRGNVYYMNSLITFDCDRLKPAIGQFNNSDVKDGIFTYTNHKKDEEYTAIDVTYVDAKDNFKPKLEYVEDSDGIRQRGVLKKQINAFGTTSRGQAIRVAKHFLFQTSRENCVVNFTTDLKALLHKPGDLISINDELYNSVKNFGSIKNVCDINPYFFKITIDKALNSGIYNTHEISLYNPKIKPKYDDYCYKLQSYPCCVSIQNLDFLYDLMPTNTFLDVDCLAAGRNRFYFDCIPALSGTGFINGVANNVYFIKNCIKSNISFSGFDENNVAAFTGNICFNYERVNAFTGIYYYPNQRMSICTGSLGFSNPADVRTLFIANFNFKYVPNSDINNSYSQYGVWNLNYCLNDSNYNYCFDGCALLDTSNTQVKINSNHSKYFWEYFDKVSTYSKSGVDPTTNCPLYLKCTYLDNGKNILNYFLGKNYYEDGYSNRYNSVFPYSAKTYFPTNNPNEYYTSCVQFNINNFSTPCISYSDIIQSDYPNIDSFTILNYNTGSCVCNNQTLYEYSELTLSKEGKSLQSTYKIASLASTTATSYKVTPTGYIVNFNNIPVFIRCIVSGMGRAIISIDDAVAPAQNLLNNNCYCINLADLNVYGQLTLKYTTPPVKTITSNNAITYICFYNLTDTYGLCAVYSDKIGTSFLYNKTVTDKLQNDLNIKLYNNQPLCFGINYLSSIGASPTNYRIQYYCTTSVGDPIQCKIIIGSPYSLKLQNQTERLFKINSISENYINEYNITASFYNPDKFKEIDENSTVDNIENTFNYLNGLKTVSKTNSAGSLIAPIISSICKTSYQGSDYIEFSWSPISSSIASSNIYYNIFIQTPSKQTPNYSANYSYSNLDPNLSIFTYRFPLVAPYEIGTYRVSVNAWSPFVNATPSTIDPMYKFSPTAYSTINIISY